MKKIILHLEKSVYKYCLKSVAKILVTLPNSCVLRTNLSRCKSRACFSSGTPQVYYGLWCDERGPVLKHTSARTRTHARTHTRHTSSVARRAVSHIVIRPGQIPAVDHVTSRPTNTSYAAILQ